MNNPFFRKIHDRAVEVAQNYRKLEGELIDLLQELDRYKIHYKMGYRSLFEYCTKGLHLSESISYSLINVARKSKEIPELKIEIQKGSLSLSKAKKITSVLTTENKSKWLDLAKSVPQSSLEREVAKITQRDIGISKMKFINDSLEVKEKMVVHKKADVRVQLQVGISEDLMLKLRRAQDVICQKRQKSTGLESVLEEMVAFYLEKQDPLELAKKSALRKTSEREGKRAKPTKELKKPHPKRSCERVSGDRSKILKEGRSGVISLRRKRTISAVRKHQIYFKWKGQCSYTDERGERCLETRFLDIHHIHPVSKGGTDDLKNLTLLCKGHHRMIHVKNS